MSALCFDVLQRWPLVVLVSDFWASGLARWVRLDVSFNIRVSPFLPMIVRLKWVGLSMFARLWRRICVSIIDVTLFALCSFAFRRLMSTGLGRFLAFDSTSFLAYTSVRDDRRHVHCPVDRFCIRDFVFCRWSTHAAEHKRFGTFR